jgi:hypothetical protein
MMSGARYEIAIDGTTRTYRDHEGLAREAASYLKKLNPILKSRCVTSRPVP